MSNIVYSFGSGASSCTVTSPFTITFQPSGISVGTGYLSKIIYQFPDKTVTRNYTFVSNSEIIAGVNKDIDSRAPLTYTFPGKNIASDNSTVEVISVSAVTAPSFNVTVYTLSANIVLQYLTKNPTGSANPCTFDEVHLLKTRVWGGGNSQIFVLETKNPNYILLNYNGGNTNNEFFF